MPDPKISNQNTRQPASDLVTSNDELDKNAAGVLLHLTDSAAALERGFEEFRKLLAGSHAAREQLRELDGKVAELNEENDGLAGLLDTAEQARRLAETKSAEAEGKVTSLLQKHAESLARIALLEGALSAVGIKLSDMIGALEQPLSKVSSLRVMFPEGAPALLAIAALEELPQQLQGILDSSKLPALDPIESKGQPVVSIDDATTILPGDSNIRASLAFDSLGEHGAMAPPSPGSIPVYQDYDESHEPTDSDRRGAFESSSGYGAVAYLSTGLVSSSNPAVLSTLNIDGTTAQEAYDYLMSLGTNEATSKAARLLERLPDQETAQSVIKLLTDKYLKDFDQSSGFKKPMIMFMILAASIYKDKHGNYSLNVLKGQIPTIYKEVSEKYHYYRSGLAEHLGWDINDLTVDQDNELDRVVFPQLVQSYRLGRGNHIKNDDKKIEKLANVLDGRLTGPQAAVQQGSVVSDVVLEQPHESPKNPIISVATEPAIDDASAFEIGGLTAEAAIKPEIKAEGAELKNVPGQPVRIDDADRRAAVGTDLISGKEPRIVQDVSLGSIRKFLLSYIAHLKESPSLARDATQVPLTGIIGDLKNQVTTLLPYLEARIKLFVSSSSNEVINRWVLNKINSQVGGLGQSYTPGNSNHASFLALLSYFDGYQLDEDTRVGRKAEDVDNNNRLGKVFVLIKQLEEAYSDQINDLDLFGLFRNLAIQPVVKRSHYSEVLFVLEQIRNGAFVKSIPRNINRGKSCDFRIKHNGVATLVEVKSLSSAEFDTTLFAQRLREAVEQLNSTTEKHSKKEIWFYLPARYQYNHEQIARVINRFNQEYPKVDVILRLVDTQPEDLNNVSQLFSRVDESLIQNEATERGDLVKKAGEILSEYKINTQASTKEEFEKNLVSGLSEVVVKLYDQVNYLIDDDVYNEIFDQFDSFQKSLADLTPDEFNSQLAAAIDIIRKIELFIAPSQQSLLNDINNLVANKALTVVRVNQGIFDAGLINQSSVASVASGVTYVWPDHVKQQLKTAITQFKATFESMSDVPLPEFLSGIQHLGHTITLSPAILDSVSVRSGRELIDQFKKAAELVANYINDILATNSVDELMADDVFATVMSSQTLVDFEHRMKLFRERPQSVTAAQNDSADAISEEVDAQLKPFYDAAYHWCSRALTSVDRRAKMDAGNLNTLTNDGIKKAIVQPVLSLLDDLLRNDTITNESVFTKIRELRQSIADENVKNNWRKVKIRSTHCATLAKLLRLGVVIDGVRVTDEMQAASTTFIQSLEPKVVRRGSGGLEAKIEISDPLAEAFAGYALPVMGGEHLAGLPAFAMPVHGRVGMGLRF